MGALWQDITYGARSLAKAPAFTLVAVLTLALGIGANTSVFTMLQGTVLRPLPGVQQADELVVVANVSRAGQTRLVSYHEYIEFRDKSRTFSRLAASSPVPMSLTIDGASERVWGEVVTGNYFEMLGVNATLGRSLQPQDDRVPGGHPVAVISYALWQRRFGSDPDTVGRAIILGDHSFTIVGVAPPGFRGAVVGLALHVFIPMMMQKDVTARPDYLEDRNVHWLIVQGRLGPGATFEHSEAEMEVVGNQITKGFDSANDDIRQRGFLLPLAKSPFGSQAFLFPILSVVMVVAGIVLLVACGNLASLMLARAARRRSEIAVRVALGASRWRIIRQLITECALLALAGGLGGLLVSVWTNEWFSNLSFPTPFPVALEARMNPLVFGFSLLICAITTVVFGLTPALQASKVDLVPALKEKASTRQVQRSRIREAVVVAQLALSMLLLTCAALVIRSQMNASRIAPGFDPAHLALASVDLRLNGYEAQEGQDFYKRILERVERLPSVQSACLGRFLPLLVIRAASRTVEVEGYVPLPNEDTSLHFNIISPSYFHTLRIPVVHGREFTAHDVQDSPDVVIVNETMARRFWPGQDPLGRKLRTGGRWRQVVGVVRDIKYLTLTEAPEPYFYLPFGQNYTGDMTLHVRTEGDSGNVIGSLRAQFHALDPNLPVFDVRTMTDYLQFSLSSYGLASMLLTYIGLLGMLLSTVGLYGVTSHNVAQRTYEIGVRMALGAQAKDVSLLILKHGIRLVILGVGVGFALALAATRFFAHLLHGLNPRDPSTFGAVMLFLSFVTLMACSLPAWRASRVDPLVALRHE